MKICLLLVEGISLLCLIVSVAAANNAASNFATQCVIVTPPEYCEQVSCLYTVINSTCDNTTTITYAPACDTTYFVSFVAMFGAEYVIFYESPLKQLDGYTTMHDAIVFVNSVKPISYCNIVGNTTAYAVLAPKHKSTGSSSRSIILWLIVGLIALVSGIAVSICGLILLLFGIQKIIEVRSNRAITASPTIISS